MKLRIAGVIMISAFALLAWHTVSATVSHRSAASARVAKASAHVRVSGWKWIARATA